MTDVQIKPASDAKGPAVIDSLRQLLGPAKVLTEMKDRVFFSTDIFVQGATTEVVIKPSSTEELSRAVALATEHGHAVIGRGGGYSYTQGYIPVREDTVMIDMQGMNKIVEINTEDLYVIVETGCTWVELYEALKAKGVRTPYFGPMSGYRSTVGGALSQGSFFLGSTQYGTTADSVMSLEVVLADGTILNTGSAGSSVAASPFFRNYGPDLTGLFLHDSGSLGVKARATLKLIPFPKAQRFGTFPFEDAESAVAAMSDIARSGLSAECYIWDPTLSANFGKRNTLIGDLKYLKGVVRSGSSLMDGIKNAARMAASGKSVFSSGVFLLHATVDDVSEAGAEERLKLIQAIVTKHGGAEVEPSAPRAMRGMPFSDFLPISEAALPERNLPVHGLFPHSKIQQVTRDIYAYFDSQKALMDQHEITCGIIFFAVGSTVCCIEALLGWKDEQLATHSRVTNTTDLESLARFPDRPEATKVVADLRKGMVDIVTAAGSAHVQIGKAYRYRQTRKPENYKLLQAIKDVVDPKGLINPGSLGLDASNKLV